MKLAYMATKINRMYLYIFKAWTTMRPKWLSKGLITMRPELITFLLEYNIQSRIRVEINPAGRILQKELIIANWAIIIVYVLCRKDKWFSYVGKAIEWFSSGAARVSTPVGMYIVWYENIIYMISKIKTTILKEKIIDKSTICLRIA